MKNIFTSVICLFLGASILSSCETCEPAVVTQVTQEDIEWLVYKKNDSVIFSDEAGKKVKYIATHAVSQTVLAEDSDPDDTCFEKLDIETLLVLQDTTNTLPDLGVYIFKTPAKLDVSPAVENSEGKVLDLDNPTHETKEIGGMTYYDVYEIDLIQSKPYSAKKIMFNKDFGYLYIEFYDGKVFTRRP